MEYNVIILRGLPGAGKSTLAKLLSGGVTDVVCEADEFMVDKNGNYDFNINRLGYAHNNCMAKFKSLVYNGTHTIIVSNTGTTMKEISPYIDLAEKNNYHVTSIIVENRHGNISIHNVPNESMMKMEGRLLSNIKLR